ncbi:MBL fold metallo-hydrolase [Pseudoduganella sp. LjRoot289]|uniref:MBL fold metallo-hydrolase n=1 Tax=Pseudoduganella sp. LjRoot289 TaxID=3342314 RepID=UPI003ECCBB93
MTALPANIHVFERGWLSSNNVLMVGRHETTLVDSGYLIHAPQTLDLVRHGLKGRRLDRIVNTHLHSDHCGGNATLQAHYGSETLIPVSEADNVRHWDEDKLSYKATGQQCHRFSFDGVLTPGDKLTMADLEWQVLGAPGHDAHSLMLFCPQEGMLISADALWQNGFGVIFPELDGESGFDEERATLDLIGTLDARIVVPGHGAVFTDVQAALKRARNRLDFLSSNPARNAEYAVKVLLKFLLLERQRMPVDEVPLMFASLPIVVNAAQRYLDKTPEEVAHWTIKQLVRACSARIESGYLLNDG